MVCKSYKLSLGGRETFSCAHSTFLTLENWGGVSVKLMYQDIHNYAFTALLKKEERKAGFETSFLNQAPGEICSVYAHTDQSACLPLLLESKAPGLCLDIFSWLRAARSLPRLQAGVQQAGMSCGGCSVLLATGLDFKQWWYRELGGRERQMEAEKCLGFSTAFWNPKLNPVLHLAPSPKTLRHPSAVCFLQPRLTWAGWS